MTDAKNEHAQADALAILNTQFAAEHMEIAFALMALAPHKWQHAERRLTASAYRKGVLAGVCADADTPEPECPYKAHGGNWSRGSNNPRAAWDDGLRDGMRIRAAVLRLNDSIIPKLTRCEYNVLAPEMQDHYSAKVRSLGLQPPPRIGPLVVELADENTVREMVAREIEKQTPLF